MAIMEGRLLMCSGMESPEVLKDSVMLGSGDSCYVGFTACLPYMDILQGFASGNIKVRKQFSY
jgi:hypothetical protein